MKKKIHAVIAGDVAMAARERMTEFRTFNSTLKVGTHWNGDETIFVSPKSASAKLQALELHTIQMHETMIGHPRYYDLEKLAKSRVR